MTLPSYPIAQALDPYCRGVGLTSSTAPDASSTGTAPSAFWKGDYAVVACWEISENAVTSLRDLALSAEGWIAQAMLDIEKNRKLGVLDGYVILALPTEPDSAVLATIRELELSSQICRKHVVWWSNSSERPGWNRLESVTVLALPEGTTAASGEPRWPDLDDRSAALWKAILENGPVAAAEAEGVV